MSRAGIGAAALLCSVVALPACQQPVAMRCGPDPAVAALLDETMQRHVQAHLAQDAEAAASDYTDDVWFRMDGGVELRGRQTMVDLYTGMYRTTRLVSFDGEDEETLVCGDAAHVVGGYTEVTEIAALAIVEGARSLREDGARRVAAGDTTVEEVLRVPGGRRREGNAGGRHARARPHRRAAATLRA